MIKATLNNDILNKILEIEKNKDALNCTGNLKVDTPFKFLDSLI